tara:strand:- start:116 stop:544 length:429 start_codon:yes stop_codon:yes gene_type:complete
MKRNFIILLLLFFITNCNTQTIYSGKVLNQESFKNINFKDKNNLVKNLGIPSFIDPISKKYFYYAEKEEKRTIFNKKLDYSYIFVFEFNSDDTILSSKVFNLEDKKNIDLIKDETSSEVVKMGLLEKIFGGVGPERDLTTSP